MSVENEEQRQVRNEKQINTAIEWLNAHWVNSKECPICAHTSWSVGQTFELREYEGGNLVVGLGSQVMPVTPVFCKNCGYMFLINSIIAGTSFPPEGKDADE
ncbi:hypothetical protein [Bifidobacterium sp. AGR2158]|uniref:hypothetical protein n=1 Tax=Bifidobacterium sp. AGR2158 TaxID=1280675 RepID=UPI0006889431|nr:hypothetical protein [Bifidobacterium sp. AGR2158]